MESEGKKSDRFKNYLKFSSLAIQMGVLITLAALGGDWLDESQENEFPIWTLILILLAIFGSLYQIIRAVIKMSKDD
jgi:uncharacterized membrane protein